ncbi:hypothetical protein [Paenibacillus roseipurpureus]|uniref:Uncharacterized protein n=1 Tax=Paenibacillus roseopurpureus TaxID=2918901 RepID=A0AA96RLA5_9BACL|nr:hypothetical protein [Paenibacillus sp. MBLB1832]WNR45141.1 hypothetical protein MJB10_03030 [Paenibacillus sp. MBLB1832]
MKSELLTISISEMWKDSFKVIAYNLLDSKFYALLIPPEDFIRPDGTVAWDVFGVSHVEIVKERGEFYKPTSLATVNSYYDKQQIIALLSRIKRPSIDFINQTMPYGVIELPEIASIQIPHLHDTKCKIVLKIMHKQIKLLNKDLRWIEYWKHAIKSSAESMDHKAQRWKAYVNTKGRKRFAVVYYHKTKDYEGKWICGFHCL